jgi:hypothetical protein
MRISPIWIPLISDEVTNFKRSLWHARFFKGFICLSLCVCVWFSLRRWC